MYKDFEVKLGASGKRLCMVPSNPKTTPVNKSPIEKMRNNKMEKVYSVSGPRLDASKEAALQAAKENLKAAAPDSDFGENLVYMGGSPYSPLMFIGEAPGEDEDIHQIPFVGLAGKQLTAIIEGGMRIPREAVVICNILKWRPPKNRTPKPEEVESAGPDLEQQIDIMRPKVIITLGKCATNWILNRPSSAPLLASRRTVHTLKNGIKVIATYHPSYLIRQYTVANRKAVLRDVTMAKNELEQLNISNWWS